MEARIRQDAAIAVMTLGIWAFTATGGSFAMKAWLLSSKD
jgi:hypothetical protein